MSLYKHILKHRHSLSYQLALALAGAFVVVGSACSSFDDYFGNEMTPSGQDTEIRTWDSRYSDIDHSRLFTTTLHKSDSIRSSNIGIAVMGAEESEGFGERRGGFFSQFISIYELNEDDDDDWDETLPFGYEPIFDSLMMLLALVEYSGDTTKVQTFNVYEATDVDILASSSDSIFFDNFDPTSLGVTDSSKPIFTFTYPDQEREIYVDSPFVRLHPNVDNKDAADDFIARLLLQDDDADNDIYDADNRDLFHAKFKGIYIKPEYEITETPDFDAMGSVGALYSFYVDGSGLELYARSKYEEDPSLIKDTILMVYPFRSTTTTALEDDYYGVTINTISRSNTPEEDVNTDILRVEGMGGVVSKITIEKGIFEYIYNEVITSDDGIGGSYNSIFVNQARLNAYLLKDAGASYDVSSLVASLVTPWMDAMPYRLGLYTTYTDYYLTASDYDDDESTLTGVEDYYYEYELYYGTTLPFNGYMNRTMGCYDMIISSQFQEAWNSYLEAVEVAEGDTTNVDWDSVEYRTFYMAPVADDLYTIRQASMQGMESSDTNAPLRLRLTYTLIKK